MNRTLTEKAKCFLFDANLPNSLWAEAINMAVYVVNRTPCTKLVGQEMKTPEEAFTKKRIDLSDLKLFGSKVMVLRPRQLRLKWDQNSEKMFFVGYDDCVKGYRCVDLSKKKTIVSRNVKFLDQEMKQTHFAFIVELCNELEPNSVKEAMKNKNSEKWIIAMNEEIDSHKENGTWELTDLPSNRKAITAKWVFKLKGHGTENERFKARLVAR